MQKKILKFHINSAVGVLLLLTFILVACSGSNTTATSSKGQVSTTSTATPNSGSTPSIQYGKQNCPAAISAATYWDAIVPSQANINKVENVSCAYLMGIPSLQALVTVRSQGGSANLDVYVYNNVTTPSPKRVFQLLSLIKGDVIISGYNSLLTAEVDADAVANKSKSVANLQRDLFREFKWTDKAATLVPVAFPALYPDLTRYQAETDQQAVNKGQDGWKLDATQVAQHFVAEPKLFNWPNAIGTVESGGGKTDGDAVVSVKSPKAGGSTIKLALSRLEGNKNGGIWLATDVTTDGMALTLPANLDRVASPLTVTGKGNASGGKIGTIKVFNNVYDQVGAADASGGNSNTTFSTNVNYTKTFKTGYEEGLIALYQYSQIDGSVAGAVMTKNLLS